MPRGRFASSRVSGVGCPLSPDEYSAPGTTPARRSGMPAREAARSMARCTASEGAA